MNIKTTSRDIRKISREAYIFFFPMLEFYRTMMLREESPNEELRFNCFEHDTELLDADYTAVVAPNNDTLYSSSWMDLRAEPIVLKVPKVKKRYYAFQLVDMYTHNFSYVGTRATGDKKGTYLIVGPNHWDDPIPKKFREEQVLKSETQLILNLGRTQVLEDDSYDGNTNLTVKEIQEDYQLIPLSQYLGTQPPDIEDLKLEKSYDPQGEIDPNAFIKLVNWLLNLVKPGYDQERMERFKEIGIGAGNVPELPPRDLAKIAQGMKSGLLTMNKYANMGKLNNGWSVAYDMFGPRETMEDKILNRAVGAQLGLFGNDALEAIYPLCKEAYLDIDMEGEVSLNAQDSDFQVTFSPENFPPVNAFWSITLYNEKLLFHPNSLDRYSLGTPHFGNEPCEAAVFISKDDPGEGNNYNWLPAPDGIFKLYLRLYWPHEDKIDPENPDKLWVPPPVIAIPK